MNPHVCPGQIDCDVFVLISLMGTLRSCGLAHYVTIQVSGDLYLKQHGTCVSHEIISTYVYSAESTKQVPPRWSEGTHFSSDVTFRVCELEHFHKLKNVFLLVW